jgi:prophage antirepressor-like protein
MSNPLNTVLSTYPVLNKDIRSITIDNEIWFVGKDVADALGYKNSCTALEGVRDRFKQLAKINLRGDIPVGGGRSKGQRKTQTIVLINEAGLNSLVLRSTLPTAEAFQDWICDKVLPAIRQTGGYIEGVSGVVHNDAITAMINHCQDAVEALSKRGDKLNRFGGLKPSEMEAIASMMASELKVPPSFALAVLIDPKTASKSLRCDR